MHNCFWGVDTQWQENLCEMTAPWPEYYQYSGDGAGNYHKQQGPPYRWYWFHISHTSDVSHMNGCCKLGVPGILWRLAKSISSSVKISSPHRNISASIYSIAETSTPFATSPPAVTRILGAMQLSTAAIISPILPDLLDFCFWRLPV